MEMDRLCTSCCMYLESARLRNRRPRILSAFEILRPPRSPVHEDLASHRGHLQTDPLHLHRSSTSRNHKLFHCPNYIHDRFPPALLLPPLMPPQPIHPRERLPTNPLPARSILIMTHKRARCGPVHGLDMAREVRLALEHLLALLAGQRGRGVGGGVAREGPLGVEGRSAVGAGEEGGHGALVRCGWCGAVVGRVGGLRLGCEPRCGASPRVLRAPMH